LKFFRNAAAIRGYAPFLGEHNREILSHYLHYSSEEIDPFMPRRFFMRPGSATPPDELKKNAKGTNG